jgi:hypothetical protein
MKDYVNTSIHFPDRGEMEEIRRAAKKRRVSASAFIRDAALKEARRKK